VTCNNAYRTWSFRIACAILSGLVCWFVAGNAAEHVWHYQLLPWQQILAFAVPGVLGLFTTKSLANWTVGCMDVPLPTAVMAAKGNARPAPSAKRPIPGRVAVPAPAAVNKQTTPQAVSAAPAVAEKPMKTILENNKVAVAVSEPEKGEVTIWVTASNMSNNQAKNENNGLFPLVRKVAGAKWENHKSIGDKRKRIVGTCPADQLEAVGGKLTEIAKRFGK
jgi:hypothetical protein